MTAEHIKKDTSPRLDWFAMCRIAPELAELHAEAVNHQDRNYSQYCANDVWRRYFKPRVDRLVGLEGIVRELADPYYWGEVCHVLTQALPPCRGCAHDRKPPQPDRGYTVTRKPDPEPAVPEQVAITLSREDRERLFRANRAVTVALEAAGFVARSKCSRCGHRETGRETEK